MCYRPHSFNHDLRRSLIYLITGKTDHCLINTGMYAAGRHYDQNKRCERRDPKKISWSPPRGPVLLPPSACWDLRPGSNHRYMARGSSVCCFYHARSKPSARPLSPSPSQKKNHIHTQAHTPHHVPAVRGSYAA